jgi:hypothetical protein
MPPATAEKTRTWGPDHVSVIAGARPGAEIGPNAVRRFLKAIGVLHGTNQGLIVAGRV